MNSDDLPISYHVVLLLLGIPLILITIFGNLIVMLVWVVHPKIRTPSNFYLISLAFVDFLIGCTNMPLGLIYNYHGKWILGVPGCQFWLTSVFSTVFVSSWHLVLIALDRYRIVFHGIQYLQSCTFKSTIQSIVVIWIFGIWVASPFLFDWSNVSLDPSVVKHCLLKVTFMIYVYFISLNLIVPGLFMTVFYVKIFQKLKIRWRQQVLELSNNPTNSNEPSSSSILSNDLTPLEIQKSELTGEREKRAITTLGLLIGIFVACWMPYVVNSGIKLLGVKPPSFLIVVFGTLGWINSAVNPIIYTVWNKDFREGIVKLYGKFKCGF